MTNTNYPHNELKKAKIGDKIVNNDADVQLSVSMVGFDRENEKVTGISSDTGNKVSIDVNSDEWIVTEGDK